MRTQSASRKWTDIQACVPQLSAQLGRWQGPGLFWESLCFPVTRWLIQMLGLRWQGEKCSDKRTKNLPGAVSSARPPFTTQAVWRSECAFMLENRASQRKFHHELENVSDPSTREAALGNDHTVDLKLTAMLSPERSAHSKSVSLRMQSLFSFTGGR